MNEEHEPEIYYDTELLHFILALDTVYWNRPWYTRWLWWPWHEALMTLALMLCGPELIQAEADKISDDTLKSIEHFLDRQRRK